MLNTFDKINDWPSLIPDNHYLKDICCASLSTYSLQPLVENPTLQQGGECQEPLWEWIIPPLDCQEVKEESLENLDDLKQQGSCGGRK